MSKNNYPLDAWDLLSERLSAERREKMLAAARERTQLICLVIQDVQNPHNISACLRSAEAFGVQNVHVVDTDGQFKVNSTAARGVSKWLTIHIHSSIAACAEAVKAAGFVLAAGMPAQNSVHLDQVLLDRPIAVLFGNEHSGVSADWNKHIEMHFTIPMVGFVRASTYRLALPSR